MSDSMIRLPKLFQDHMILQRGKVLKIWGTADKAVREVTVEIDGMWAAGPVLDGVFLIRFPALQAGEEKTVYVFSDSSREPEITLSHVAVGDVFLACGQSNMEYYLRYDAYWHDTRRLPVNSHIHMYNVPRIAFEDQKWDRHEDSGFWFDQADPAWETFSAPGFYFAQEIQAVQNIPIGIIGCNWGGTPACAWLAEQYMETAPLNVFLREYEDEVKRWDSSEMEKASDAALAYENSYRHQIEWRAVMYGLSWEDQKLWMKEHAGEPVLPVGPWHHYRPAGLYHTMLGTIMPFAIRGVLWYQGEGDAGHADIYDKTMEAVIACFRESFEDKEMPFLFVQLAPFERWLDCTGDGFVLLREKQEKVSQTVSNTYMTSIMDIGDKDDIHPKNKKEVGRRLALLARGHLYKEPVSCDPPEICGVDFKDHTICISLKHVEGGLLIGEKAEDCFSITQDEGQLQIDKLVSDKNKLILKLKSAGTNKGKIKIEFARKNYCEVRIWNQMGLPLKPFSCVV